MKATLRKQLRDRRRALHESDTAALIAAAWRRGVQVLPVIGDRRHCRMRFYPLVDSDGRRLGMGGG